MFHLTSRVDWRAWHLEDERLKVLLATAIQDAIEAYEMGVVGFVFMSNHFHIVTQSPAAEEFARLTGRRTKCRHFRPWPKGHPKASVLGQFMRRVRRTTALLVHKKLGLTGRFWEGPFHARPLPEASDIAVAVAYDHRNPVRAGMFPEPNDYTWSSASWWAMSDATPISLTIPRGVGDCALRSEILDTQQRKALDDLAHGIGERGNTAAPGSC